MAHAQKQWRLRKAAVLSLAESSSDDHEENVPDFDAHTGTVQEAEGDANVSHLNHHEDSDGNSDYGILEVEGVLSLSSSSSSDSDSESEEMDGGPGNDAHAENTDMELGEQLARWATKHSSSRAGLNEILEIFRQHGHRLPKDGRTLLQTPKIVVTTDKCGGKYIYYGLESDILRNLSQRRYNPDDNTISINVNIDGLPLFKSSLVQFWPILCSFYRFEPFIVALFCGSSNPSPVHDYLADFIQELQELCQNGITHDTITYRISVRSFICDAPARSYLKCIKGHSGYDSCERCTVHGSWNGRVVFNSGEAFPSRTDQDFQYMMYEGTHQFDRSPLIDTGISCVKQFVIDYMHSVCPGVVKRILVYLKQGPHHVCRLSCQQKKADLW